MITTLDRLADWNDAGLLRERLAETRAAVFLTPTALRREGAIVRRLRQLTGRTAEALRATADQDALALEDC